MHLDQSMFSRDEVTKIVREIVSKKLEHHERAIAFATAMAALWSVVGVMVGLWFNFWSDNPSILGASVCVGFAGGFFHALFILKKYEEEIL